MQVYRKSKLGTFKTVLFFFVVMFLAYLPVSSFLFFLKNDAFNGYYPSKFFISESLHKSQLPFWNPYINFGLPQYGDMNSGFWSPFTWFLADTVGYNVYSFTIELLFYLFVAGTGMFVLCRSFKITTTVAVIAGTAYMCSGYMVGHLQHFNWVSGASFLPWCLWAYTCLQKRLSLRNIIIASSLFYFLAASAHPGIIIGSLYFFIAHAVFLFFRHREEGEQPKKLRQFLVSNFLMLSLLALLSAGMIAGYADVLPHITRGEKVDTIAAMSNPVSLQSSISALLPLSVTKQDSFFSTDISMRNIYFGLSLLMFFLLALMEKKSKEQKFFLITGVVFFLLSLGGIFKTVSYHIIPLMAYIRLNGEFAVFAILCFILVAAFSMNEHIKNNRSFSGKIASISHLLTAILFVAILAGIGISLATHNSFLFQLSDIFSHNRFSMKLKKLIDHISFSDAFWIQGSIQLTAITLLKYCMLRKKSSLFIKICVADLVLATLLNVPFTGVGRTSPRELQQILNKAPDAIPLPGLQPINQRVNIGNEESRMVGDWSFYNKQIGAARHAFYPVELKTTKDIFENDRNRFADKPCLFTLIDSNATDVAILSFLSSSIEVTVTCEKADTLVYQQNSYPHWRCVVNDREMKPLLYEGVFLAAPLKPGRNYIQFEFEPVKVNKAFHFSAITFFIMLLVFIITYVKRFSPSSRRR
jgi:hypothetical protein